MTNITLAIEDKTYKKMRQYTDIRWSEFVRKAIQQRLKLLEHLENKRHQSITTMLASEKSLAKLWNTKEEDKAWNTL